MRLLPALNAAPGKLTHRLHAVRPPSRLAPFRQLAQPRRDQHIRRRLVAQQATASSPAAKSVEQGLELFQQGKFEEALALFVKAQQQNPNDDEGRAACYNAACAHTKLRQWKLAADAVVKAINDYDLKLSVALKDPDLDALRERREWSDALVQVKGGMSEQQYIKLRSEAKAPFRFTRIYLFGSLAAGAGLGLLIISTRLIAALQGDGDLQEALTNFAVNSGAVALFGFLLYRDLQQQQRDDMVIQREEALGKLQVQLGPERIVLLSLFRGSTRPVIVAGSKGQVARALSAAEPYIEQLRERGVSVIPIIMNDDDPQERLRRLKLELAEQAAASGAQEQQSKGFGSADAKKPQAPPQQTELKKTDRKWQLEPVNLAEWMVWVEEQKQFAQIGDSNSVYIQVQLDGSVRASGVGAPDWRLFIRDLPELNSVRTKFTDGRMT